MFAKKELPPTSGRTFQKELEYLYARRNTVNTLIRSLEEYDRFRELNGTRRAKRKLA
jgi:hypothetical protein